jgi:hypothetical protein
MLDRKSVGSVISMQKDYWKGWELLGFLCSLQI